MGNSEWVFDEVVVSCGWGRRAWFFGVGTSWAMVVGGRVGRCLGFGMHTLVGKRVGGARGREVIARRCYTNDLTGCARCVRRRRVGLWGTWETGRVAGMLFV